MGRSTRPKVTSIKVATVFCVLALAIGGEAANGQNETTLQSELALMQPFMGAWKAAPMDGREGEFYVRRTPTLGGWAFTTSEGVSRGGGAVQIIVENITGWNNVEGAIWFQEHSSWGNFVRGEIEQLDDHVVRRYMTVWNVDGTYNLWWETWTYDSVTDTYTTQIRRVIKGSPVEDEAFPSMQFERVGTIPEER